VVAAITLAWTADIRAAIHAEAYCGEPFGVGRITVSLSPDARGAPWDDDRVAVVEHQGRIIYPVMTNQPVRRMVRKFLGIGGPRQVDFYFMFRGDKPLDVAVYSPAVEHVTVSPKESAKEFGKLLDDWWDATADRYRQVYRETEFPIVVQNYLTTNWARRLRRDMPQPPMYLLRRQSVGGSWISQLVANEAYQTVIERDIVLGRFSAHRVAEVSLPEPPSPQPLQLAIPASGVEVEPIAVHVPHECFYLRFGNFPNYLWFRDFLRKWQGDLGNMLVERSIDRQTSERFQQQIAVGESKLARVMGPAVIEDVAIIGLDAYLRDGAAMGILFQAKNNLILSNNLNTQRRKVMANHPDSTEENLSIADHEVSYIASPDGRLRSYYAVDGDYHLVTTSRRLVERFFEAGNGNAPLAASEEFQHARSEMPISRGDTVFLYLPAAFFENLASPHYRVELDRRLRSVGEMRILQIARLAAQAEGNPAQSIDDLEAAEFLPRNFAEHADGSQLLETEAGMRDSLRGLPGWFIPVADMTLDKITPVEAHRFLEFQQDIHREAGQFVPVAAALRRDASDDGTMDHIAAEVRIAPYSQTRLAHWAERLGPAETLRVAPIPGDVVSAEVIWGGLGKPVHLFGGLRDSQPPLVIRQGEARPTTPLWQSVRGYVGTWPRPHLFDRLFGEPTEPFDDDGVARGNGLFDVWQRRLDDFFLFSLQRDVLMEVGPQLAMVEAERAAQLRLRIADLSDKQIETTISGLGYMQSRTTSASGSRFMNSLATQLGVPPAEARELAESLVGGRFDCPLGGEYELMEASDGRALWASTAMPAENRFLLTTIPTDYAMPLIAWFRGLSLDVTRKGDALMLHAELDMVHQEVEPPADKNDGGLSLPSLGNLLGEWGKPNMSNDAKNPSSSVETPAIEQEDGVQ
jgi:hypothetical protein